MDDNMVEKTEQKKIWLLLVCYIGVLGLVGGLITWFEHNVLLEQGISKNALLMSGLFAGIILLYSALQRNKLFLCTRSFFLMVAFLIMSALIFLLSDFYMNVPIWLIGGILTAALVDRDLGMLYVYFFVYQALILEKGSLNGVILHFIVATVICISVSMMKSWLAMLYTIVLSSSLTITVAIILSNLNVNKQMVLDAFYIAVIYAIIIGIAMVLKKFLPQSSEVEEIEQDYSYLERVAMETSATEEAEHFFAEYDPDMNKIQKENEEKIVPQEAIMDELREKVKGELRAEIQAEVREKVKDELYEAIREELAAEMKITNSESDEVEKLRLDGQNEKEKELLQDYSEYARKDAELLKKMKDTNKSVFAHSILVGNFSCAAAASVDANQTLAKAAGYYHELWKLTEGADKEKIGQIARNAGLPEALCRVMEECVKEQDKISCKEAAIVMFSDKVLHTYALIRKMKSDKPAEVIVENTIGKFLLTGAMNQSGLSVSDCVILKNFYTDQLNKQDEKKKK